MLACIVGLGSVLTPAMAHDGRPLSVEIIAQSGHFYVARMRVPPSVPIANIPKLIWPADCIVLSDDATELASEGRETISTSCRDSLQGQQIRVAYPVFNPALPTVFQFHAAGSADIIRVLPPEQAGWRVPRAAGWREVAGGYLRLGIRHICTGIDHLLFIAGLVALAGSMRRVLVAVTGFTVAHSITLSLSTLHLVVLPEPPVEAAIALSILFVAREIARPGAETVAQRFPVAVSASFGLLHGFGFAAALREAGLPAMQLAVGLAFFNLGVEIGQIAFIAGLITVLHLLRVALRRGEFTLGALRDRSRELYGYVLGIPAAFWFLERLAAFAAR